MRHMITLVLPCLTIACSPGPGWEPVAGEVEQRESMKERSGDEVAMTSASQDKVRASHILIPYKGAASAADEVDLSKEAALKKATELYERAKAEGTDFAALAKEHSSCPSSAKGGDLGTFGRGAMVKPFEEATFGAEVGEIVGPVETPFGFHVIKRTE